MAFEKNPDEIGALWTRSNDRGDYMTGEIDGVKVICSPVKSDNPNAPAWRVKRSKAQDVKNTPHHAALPDDESGVPF